MSYDVTLFRVPEGTDPSVAYQKMMEQEEIESADLGEWMKRPVPDKRRADMERVATALESWRPSLAKIPASISTAPWIELNHDDLQIQFHVYEAMVSVTMPYFRDRAEEMMRCVTESFEVLKSAADYVAYDPQLERIVQRTDLGEMVARYRGMDRALPEILAHSRNFVTDRKKPWWRLWRV